MYFNELLEEYKRKLMTLKKEQTFNYWKGFSKGYLGCLIFCLFLLSITIFALPKTSFVIGIVQYGLIIFAAFVLLSLKENHEKIEKEQERNCCDEEERIFAIIEILKNYEIELEDKESIKALIIKCKSIENSKSSDKLTKRIETLGFFVVVPLISIIISKTMEGDKFLNSLNMWVNIIIILFLFIGCVTFISEIIIPLTFDWKKSVCNELIDDLEKLLIFPKKIQGMLESINKNIDKVE